MNALDPGTVIGGRFEIERQVAVGGMGSVFRAIDRKDNAQVAVKILHTDKPTAIERFEREADLLAGLDHPGIVRYITHGFMPTDERYLVLEWLSGEDLEQRLARQKLTPLESLTILRQVASALMGAHARGVFHRDIKPSNIFVVGGRIDQIKILDFGIARFVHHAVQLTGKGMIVGTPAYMAPEQARGLPICDPRADVFSLGCVLFECLTGRPPFEGFDAMAVLTKIILQESPRLRSLRPDLPEPLERLVHQMLAKNPDERPEDAGEIARELESLERRSLSGALALPVTPSRRPPPMPAAESSEKPEEAASLTSSEQRVVSVVLAGTLRLDGSMVTLDLSTLELDRYGGRIDVLPNGVMVVTTSGSSRAADRAGRAARCALALRERFPHVPICVVTGRGVVSEEVIGGDILDRGVRSLHAARPGSIWLDDATAELLSERFLLEKEANTFVLRGEQPRRHVTQPSRSKSTLHMGRSQELLFLEQVFSSCVEERRANAVLVTGPAGIGKSSLCRAFLQKLERSGEPFEVASGRADSLAERAPFGIIADAIRDAARIDGGEPIPQRRHKLLGRLGRHLSGERLERASVFLGEMAGASFPDDHSAELRDARASAQLLDNETRAAFHDFLAAECDARPFILALDDLELCDAATMRLLGAVMRNLRDKPLLLLLMARPEVHARFPGLFAWRDIPRVQLAPLTRKASAELVRDRLPEGTKDSVISRIVARGDGNPFYLKELIRALASNQGDALPDVVLEVVEARFDAEGAEAKRVLRAASVFGERFTARAVASLLGGGARLDKIAAALHKLAESEFIAAAPASSSDGDVIYTFHHALVREAAYASLTEPDRALGRRLADAWLEAEVLGLRGEPPPSEQRSSERRPRRLTATSEGPLSTAHGA